MSHRFFVSSVLVAVLATCFTATVFGAPANYGQARYLCYYLQQQGLLREFYRRFHTNREKDPTGYATLQEVLGRTWPRFSGSGRRTC
jgi:hypothetical protein